MRSNPLSPAQLRALSQAAQRGGLLEYIGTRGLGSAARDTMMSGLCRRGLFVPYVHGGYEITPQGRAALAAATQRPSMKKRSATDTERNLVTDPKVDFVTCLACGHEQADMGNNVACERCEAMMPAGQDAGARA